MVSSGCLVPALAASSEFDIADVGHAFDVGQSPAHIFRDLIIDGDDHDGTAARRISAQLQRGDVDIGLTEGDTHLPDPPRNVVVVSDEESPRWFHVDTELADAHQSGTHG